MSGSIELADSWEIVEADDLFHPAKPDESAWVETMWFAFMVPERRLLGYFYPVFRLNQKLQYGGVRIGEGDAELPWEIPIYHWEYYTPMQPDLDLRDFSLPGGMSVRCTSPGRRLELTYRSDELTLDLTFEALMRPLRSESTGPFTANGHLDQPGRVTGELVMHGERIAVDCLAMRDRGWGPRRDNGKVQMGYAYAIASERSAFLSVSGTGRSGKDKVVSGFLMRDGVWAKMASGERVVTREERGRAVAFDIQATDELGRELHAKGEVVSRWAGHATPGMLVWANLVRWSFDGHEVYGEDQDCWPPRKWRDFARDLRSGGPRGAA